MSQPLEFLARLLVSRIRATNCQIVRHRAPFEIQSVVVPTPRLIFVPSGKLKYTIERSRFNLTAGSMLYVPERTRRQWSIARGSAIVAWFEFSAEMRETLTGNYLLLKHCDLDLENAAFARVHRLLSSQKRRELQAEGEVKAILSRFFSAAASTRSSRVPTRGHGQRSIEEALAWLSAHHSSPDVLDGLPRRVGLSPNHFRLLFRQATGMSANAHLLSLRMRAARSLLQESALSIKEIAQRSGYPDQLYFSRQYRRFWRRSPSEDRVFRP